MTTGLQHSKYLKCGDVNTLESAPHNSILRLEGWMISRHGDSSFCLYDGVGGSIRIQKCADLEKDIPNSHWSQQLPLIHVRVRHIEDYDFYSWARNRTEVYYHKIQPGKCDCGAVYTFMPDHHSLWCNSHIWE